MPTVVSKLVDKSAETYKALNLPKNVVATSIVAATLFLYGVKISYPLVEKYLYVANNERTKIENNNYANDKIHVKSTNGHIIQRDGTNTTTTAVASDSCTTDASTSTGATTSNGITSSQQASRRRKNQPGLNKRFVIQFLKLIRIMIPNIFCHETGLLSVHTICLVLRTFLSIYVASMEGAIVKYIVRRDVQNFFLMLLKWFAIAIPATGINSLIRYLESKLAIAFRSRLVEYSYELYFKNSSYYRVCNLDGRIENPEHRLTDDIDTLSTSVARLYSQITKPCFDLLLIGLALAKSTRNMGAAIVPGPLLAVVVISITAYVLRVVSPKFGALVAEEADRRGYLRHVHSRLVANAEEIAFYKGHKVELYHLRHAYARLVEQMNKILSQKLWFVMLEQFLMKYVWSGTGMVMVSLPIIMAKATQSKIKKDEFDNDGGVSERTQYFTTARNLLLSGSDAVERLMSSYKEVVELAGYTSRVYTMFEVFNDTSKGIYKKAVVDNVKRPNSKNGFTLEFKDGQPLVKGKIFYTTNYEIKLINVPIITPNCDIVCPNLNLHITPGMHLLITGPNGCGKSSLFRILSGLWPIYSGELHIPKNSMFYIPQRPYMVIGCLRDQIIYPDTYVDMINKQVTEEQLRNILKMVYLEHILDRDGFDQVRDWKDTLSGGEKQRMAIARLFYHKAKYALLDECTSAVSIDVESEIYQTAKDLGITLLTITHRPTLWKFHTHVLQFDGEGGWTFNSLDSQQRLTLREEKEKLEKELSSLPSQHARLQEICKQLGENSEVIQNHQFSS